MRRFSRDHVIDCARRFAASTTALSWHLFGSEIRGALLDAAVMDEMRIADSARSAQTLFAEDICEFRRTLEQCLLGGVRPANSRAPMRSYRVGD